MTSPRQIRFWLLGFALFLVAVYLLRGILLPFVAGMAIAYFLDPACDRLERLGLSRTWSTTVVTLVFAAALIAGLLILVPLLQNQIVAFAERLPSYLDRLEEAVLPLIRDLERSLPKDGLEGVRGAISGEAGNIIGWIGGALAGLVSSGLALVNILSLVFITPIVAFYLLRDWDRLIARVDTLLPRGHAEEIREQARRIDRILAGWVRGQGVVCLLLAAFYGGALTIVGLDFGLAVGLLSGLISFVPYLGSITGFVASTGIALAQYSEWGPIAIVVAIFVVGQVVEGNFLTPKLVGDRVELHPVWVIFALLAGGALFGFVGVLLALPVAAASGVLVRFALSKYLQSRYYREGETVPPEPAPTPSDSGGSSEPPPV